MASLTPAQLAAATAVDAAKPTQLLPCYDQPRNTRSVAATSGGGASSSLGSQPTLVPSRVYTHAGASLGGKSRTSLLLLAAPILEALGVASEQQVTDLFEEGANQERGAQGAVAARRTIGEHYFLGEVLELLRDHLKEIGPAVVLPSSAVAGKDPAGGGRAGPQPAPAADATQTPAAMAAAPAAVTMVQQTAAAKQAKQKTQDTAYMGLIEATTGNHEGHMADPAKKLRSYQSRIASTCESFNTIVVLPTGSGKTLIAAEVIKRLPSPALFLVPTCLLVEQQAEALRSWNSGHYVAEYKGGMALPPSFDVLVSTPEAFKVAQRSSSLLNWSIFAVVVFDEVHHVLKEHPYRKLALSLRRSSLSSSSSSSSSTSRNHPRVVGLTASYSYAVGDAKTKASLTRMCHELRITNTETATTEELEASGYHARGAAAEVSLSAPRLVSAPATRATATAPPGVVPKADRKPHEMGPTFFGREKRGACTAFARLLMACVRSMEDVVVTQKQSTFESPMPPSGKLAPREWGAYAHKLAKVSGEARGASTAGGCSDGRGGGGGGGVVSRGAARKCTRCGVNDTGKCPGGGGHNRCQERSPPQPAAQPAIHRQLAELEHWYEAVKTLVVSWEEGEDEATTILDMFGCTGSPSYRSSETKQEDIWPTHVLQNMSAFWAKVPATFPRYEHLKNVLLEKYKHHGGGGGGGGSSSSRVGKSFRGIVFVRQRVTTHALAHVIASDARLAPLLSTACLYASSSPATASLSVTKAQAQASIRAFRSGGVNLLLATVVAEEGMDVPAANCVVRYDEMVHAVSLVQGRGRAREEDSSFVVLRERSDRTTADLEAVERQQQQLVKRFKPPPAGGAAAAAADAALAAAQRSRERGARVVLLATAAADGGGALSAVNLFCRKTKAVLEEDWSKATGGLCACTLSYESPLREVSAVGTAAGKKAAKKLAAAKLLAGLRAAVPA